MLHRAGFLLIALATVAGPLACRDGAPSPGAALSGAVDESPSIVGTITAFEQRRVRVEEDPAASSGSAKAVVRLLSETRIVGPGGASWTADSLRVGQRVRVWFSGPVAESYPVQTAAGRIEVE